jgi:NAD-dependent deacetylase sirtuin 2
LDDEDNDQDDNDNEDEDKDRDDQEDGDAPASPARGIPLDCEGVDSADSEQDSVTSSLGSTDEERNAMLRRILAAAAAQGIPLEFLACMQADDDDEPVTYPFDEPPRVIKDIATFIQSPNCKKILVLAGAGMSVASGIPDFRSPNGLYATLQADSLTATQDQRDRIRMDPSYSLDQHLFMENPLPCLEVNREFVLGIQSRKWKATLAHRFVELLQEKTGKLCRLYTQNIDGLEDQCGLPHNKRIAVHGSMDEACCAVCQEVMPMQEFCEKLQNQIKDITGKDSTAPKESTPIRCPRCHAPAVKPNIVLFRSSLPKEFFQNVPVDTKDVDLLIVMGTSLGVAPANR